MNEKAERVKELLADENFAAAVFDAENEQAVQKLFADKGVEMSLTEIELMGEMMCALADGKVTEEQLEKLSNGGELSEEELSEAAGGAWYDVFFNYAAQGEKITGDEYRIIMETSGNAFKSMSGKGWAAVAVGGTLAAIGAAAGIAQACGVDVAGGIKTGYNWCKEKITSRW